MSRSHTLSPSTLNGGVAGPFVYPSAPTAAPANGSNPTGKVLPDCSVQLMWTASHHKPEPAKTPKYTEEELQARLNAKENAVREQVLQETDARLRAEYTAALEEERTAVAKTVEEFTGERKTYFERAEGEVVQLALSIARKILEREALVDPLFLSGAVRVALERVTQGSAVRLRVAENEVFKWRRTVGAFQSLQPKPEVAGDSALPPGHCIIETDVGTAEVSLEGQFRVIEKGLLDLVAMRPQSPPAGAPA